jgi:hypothetical protein
MRRSYTILGLLFTIVAPWTDAVACSCLRPVLADLYQDSTHVIFGEVVRIDLVTKNPVHGEKVTYVATVKPIETYKGPSDVEARVTFTEKYVEPGGSLPEQTVVSENGETLVLVGGCEWGMAVGLKYVVFEKKDAPLNYYGWCGDRVMSDGIIKLDYMRTLRDAR